jgi:2-desacetyl-2-hydroxyethyl bacteriochlorophyllide A dehydrogenase
MLAARFKVGGQPLSIDDIEVPKVGVGDVLVEVKIAGLCGTDVHYRRGEFEPEKIPLVLGHEGAGVVKQVGSNVTHVKPGDRVVAHYVISCDHCKPCLQGHDNWCRNRQAIGHSVDGTFAEYIRIPARSAIRMPENVPMEYGAITACAVSTAFHALGVSGIEKGDDVVVFGLGAVGLHAVMWAKFYGAGRIMAVDPIDSKLETSHRYGADILVNPLKTDAVELIRSTTEGWGADVVIECSGSQRAMEQAVKAVRGKNQFHTGTLVSVGLQTQPWQVEYWGFREGWLTVSGDHTRSEIEQVLKLIALGRVDLSRSITHRISLREIDYGIELLESNREHVEKVVIDMGKR